MGSIYFRYNTFSFYTLFKKSLGAIAFIYSATSVIKSLTVNVDCKWEP